MACQHGHMGLEQQKKKNTHKTFAILSRNALEKSRKNERKLKRVIELTHKRK